MDKMNSSDKTVDIKQDSTRNRKNQTEILSLNIRKGFISKNNLNKLNLKSKRNFLKFVCYRKWRL